MGGIKGDFTGFQFGESHSSDFGITRVSQGSRYNDNLLPNLQDKTAQVPGGDGTYYWDSNYTQKPFNLNIAFDDVTEENFEQLRRWLGTRDIKRLIFDETPYKYYMAKVSSPPQLNYICFDVGDARVYKGEGTIQFVCYYPYAKSVYKWLNEYNNSNKDEWSIVSGMKDIQGDYDKPGTRINLYNPGIMETDFTLRIVPNDEEITIKNETNNNTLKLKAFSLKAEDDSVQYNSKTNLLEGVNNGTLTGTLYNEHIVSGDFFKVPMDESSLTISGADITAINYEYIYY